MKRQFDPLTPEAAIIDTSKLRNHKTYKVKVKGSTKVHRAIWDGLDFIINSRAWIDVGDVTEVRGPIPEIDFDSLPLITKASEQ